jgi:hypothetical protein
MDQRSSKSCVPISGPRIKGKTMAYSDIARHQYAVPWIAIQMTGDLHNMLRDLLAAISSAEDKSD